MLVCTDHECVVQVPFRQLKSAVELGVGAGVVLGGRRDAVLADS